MPPEQLVCVLHALIEGLVDAADPHARAVPGRSLLCRVRGTCKGVNTLRSAALLSIVLALSMGTLMRSARRPREQDFLADVTRVADGDTVEVLIPPARKVRIRLHGVDTPEAKEPFSNQARTFTRVLMFGRRVTVVGKDVDRYDRLVARIAVDNVDASESIIAAGLGCTVSDST